MARIDEVLEIIGLGTVLNAVQARAASDAGAQFIVSPTTNFATIEACQRSQIAVMPGALTPTEILAAWEAGAVGGAELPQGCT